MKLKNVTSKFVLLFQDIFAVLSPLHYHINFRISLSFLQRKKITAEILVEIASNLLLTVLEAKKSKFKAPDGHILVKAIFLVHSTCSLCPLVMEEG